MTDNEIINWWREIIELCNECHPDSFKNVLSKDIANATLDLINRQKAEIERFEKIEHFATKTIEKQQAEIERLKKTVVDLNANITDLIFQKEKAKSEAIKEFAERLKKAFPSIAGAIDYTKKEMVGDNNGKEV